MRSCGAWPRRSRCWMDDARNSCALKGGTALPLQAELSRPSIDLDFDGDEPVSVRKTLLKALPAAAPNATHRPSAGTMRRQSRRHPQTARPFRLSRYVVGDGLLLRESGFPTPPGGAAN